MCRAAPSSQSSGLPLPLIKMRSLILAWTLVAARAANTCPGQAACSGIIPCAADYFCNFDYGSSGTCEQCSSFSDSTDCYNDGLPSDGAADCHACCFDGGASPAPTPDLPEVPTPTAVPVLCGNQILRRVRAESSRRPPRHRCDACSMAWRCAPDALVDFHTDLDHNSRLREST